MRRVGQTRRRDVNEKAIVDALRAVGASIVRVSEVGAPDLIVGYRGVNTLMEIKGAQGLIRATQEAWRSRWRGQVVTIRTVDEALTAVGAGTGTAG